MRRFFSILLSLAICVLLPGCHNYYVVINGKEVVSEVPLNAIYSRTATAIADVGEVESAGSFINEMSLAERRVQAYLEFYKTNTFYQHIAEKSGTGMNADDVGGMLEFTQGDTAVFYVKITGHDIDVVNLIADTVCEELQPFIEQYQSNSSIRIVEHGEMVLE